MDVSIHAPARGATIYNTQWHDSHLFQSTHPQGVRLGLSVLVSFHLGFNPRTRKGCDVPDIELAVRLFGFNPRTRKGCDLALASIVFARKIVSIHAPARGATNGAPP